MEYTTDLVNQLREESGSGLTDCVHALKLMPTYELAKRYLRLRGIALYVKPGEPTPMETFLVNVVPQDVQDKLDALNAWINDLHSRMYVNCVYCGHRYESGATRERLTAHVETCPEHPMSDLKKRHNRALSLLTEEQWKQYSQYMFEDYMMGYHHNED